MDRPRFQRTEAIVLKHTNIGEADRILTLYTPHSGKMRAVARGVRKAKSRLAGHVELLTRAQVLVHRGKTLDVISQAATIASNEALSRDLWRMACGLYMSELVEGFTEEQLRNPGVYRLLRDCLWTLGAEPAVDALVRWFELRLVDLVGFRPELEHCVECTNPLEPVTNYFSPKVGGVLCPTHRDMHTPARPISVNVLKVMRLMLNGTFDSASRVRLARDVAGELEALMRQYIRYLLGRDVKSVEFLDLIRRERSATA